MALATTGITTSMVGSTLGTTSRNVSTLCTHSNINKWSKYKPVQINSAAPNRSSNWYTSDDGLCGFKTDSIIFGSADSLISAYNNKTTYQYQPPTGYKRLADFGGYDHAAKSPVYAVEVEGIIYKDTTSSYINMICQTNDVTSTNLQMSDILPAGTAFVSDCYFGVVVKVGNVNYYKTNKNKVGSSGLSSLNGNNNVEIYGSELSTVGTYSIYPAIFNLPYTSFTSNASGTKFIAIAPPSSNIFQTSFSVKNSAYDSQIWWASAWYSQAAKLTMGGTIGYNARYEGSNITVTYWKKYRGTRTEFVSHTVKLTKSYSSGDNNYMDIEYTRNAASESGVVYGITARLSTYRTETQCEDMGQLEPMTITE